MSKNNIIKKFLKDKSASVIPTFAVMIMPLLFTIGAAFDYADSARKRSKLASVADAAILAAAVEVNQSDYLDDFDLVKAKMESTINDFIAANMAGESNISYQVSNVRYDPVTLAAELDINYSNSTHIMQLAGVDEIDGKIETALFLNKPDEQSFSMYLVLDKSGSMGWYGRMTALKNAISEMTTDFRLKDPDENYIRMGAIAYDSKAKKPTNLAWGVDKVNNYTQSLRAGGGTDSSKAMQKAAKALKGDKEKIEHQYNNTSDPKKYIIFMTDGENNQYKFDTKTLKQCSKAKNDDVIIYTVAFQAPIRGQNLLKSCATSISKHYFKADNAADLINIFKLIGENAGQNLTLTK